MRPFLDEVLPLFRRVEQDSLPRQNGRPVSDPIQRATGTAQNSCPRGNWRLLADAAVLTERELANFRNDLEI
jgi:hypothetical protein